MLMRASMPAWHADRQQNNRTAMLRAQSLNFSPAGSLSRPVAVDLTA